MRLLLLCLSLLIAIADARENPFKPIITPKESGVVSEPPPARFFVSDELKLPSSARRIKKILIEYQNMDGTIESVYKELDNDIDWHFPIIVSQDVVLDSAVAMDDYKIMVPPQISENRQTFKPFPFLKFELTDKKIEILTEDVKLRDFAIAEPTKIVLDFKRDVLFKSETITTSAPYFEEIAIGNHKDSYRIAIKLDGKYRYDIKQTNSGYTIELK